MRAYLLGALPLAESAKLEERYFTDATLLSGVQETERALIADYLAGRLAPGELASFEERYVRNPAMSAKLAAAARRQEAPEPGRSGPWALPRQAGAVSRSRTGTWGLALAAAFVALVGLGAVWTLRQRAAAPVLVASAPPVALPAAELFLTPGVSKGPGTASRDLTAPVPASGARLVLELPGVKAGMPVGCKVYRVDAEGQRLPVWSLPAALPTSAAATISIVVPAEALSAVADYLAEVTSGSTGEPLETYLFRVVAK